MQRSLYEIIALAREGLIVSMELCGCRRSGAFDGVPVRLTADAGRRGDSGLILSLSRGFTEFWDRGSFQ